MKKVLVFLAVAMVLICGLGGYVYMKGAASKAAEAQAAANGTTTITRGNLIATVVDNGAIEAVRTVELKSNVSGRLSKLQVEEGDLVKAGQLIAVVDPKETQLRVAQDRAQLAGAQSAADRADIQITQRRVSVRAEYNQAKARLAELEAQLRIQ